MTQAAYGGALGGSNAPIALRKYATVVSCAEYIIILCSLKAPLAVYCDLIDFRRSTIFLIRGPARNLARSFVQVLSLKLISCNQQHVFTDVMFHLKSYVTVISLTGFCETCLHFSQWLWIDLCSPIWKCFVVSLLNEEGVSQVVSLYKS